jgi:CheY-like chemotaxis protein
MSSSSVPIPRQSAASTTTVLIVEDDVLNRLLFADYLREHGFSVIEAGSAAEAVEVLLTDDLQVDLVFSDVSMPGSMDGFGLLQWVKANKRDLPIIITSGDARRRATARNLYAHEPFVDKPYDFDAVIARIRKLIEQA